MSAAQGIGIACFIASFVCYAIGVSLTWVFSQALYLESVLAFCAAVVISLPLILTVIGVIIVGCCGSSDNKAAGIECGVGIGFGSISALFDLIGVILLIVAMVQAPSDLKSPAGAIVCGVFAIIFVIGAGITSCITFTSCAVGAGGEKSQQSSD